MNNRIILSIALALCTSILFAQDMTTSLGDFSRVDAATSVSVELIQSDDTRAEVWIEEGDRDDFVLEELGSRISIKWKDRAAIWKKGNMKRKATVKLYYKTIDAIEVSAGAKVRSDDVIKASDFDLEASSGGGIDIQIKAESIDADVSSGGWVEVSGSSDKLRVEASSGGSYRGKDCEVKDVRANASSGGNAKVWVTESISAKASSGGNVKYKGNPSKKDISSSKWSGGSVRAL